MRSNPKNSLVSSKTAAERIGVTQNHVRWLIAQGRLKAEKIGRAWLIMEKDLKDMTRQRQRKKD